MIISLAIILLTFLALQLTRLSKEESVFSDSHPEVIEDKHIEKQDL